MSQSQISRMHNNDDLQCKASIQSSTKQHCKRQEKAMSKGQKGKSKGKSKTKGKSLEEIGNGKGLPKFGLRQAFPSMNVSTWHLVQKDIEAGKEPSGSVAICPSIEKMSELEALSEARNLKNGIVLMCSSTDQFCQAMKCPKRWVCVVVMAARSNVNGSGWQYLGATCFFDSFLARARSDPKQPTQDLCVGRRRFFRARSSPKSCEHISC